MSFRMVVVVYQVIKLGGFETMNKQIPRGCSLVLGLGIGAISALVGAYIVGISLGFLPSRPEDFSAPRLEVAAAGMCFFFIGVWAALKSVSWAYGQDTPAVQWLGFLLTLAMMLTFAGIFLWVGLGPGERQFQVTSTIGPLTTSGPGDELTGRLVFGGIGFLAAGVTLWYAITRLRKLLGKQPDPKLPEQDKLPDD